MSAMSQLRSISFHPNLCIRIITCAQSEAKKRSEMKKLSFRQTLKYLEDYGRPRNMRMFTLTKDLPCFKRAITQVCFGKDCIINLIIPAGTKVHIGKDGTFNKCRAARAIVHSIWSCDGEEQYDQARSSYSPTFIYIPGTIVNPAYFSDYNITCGGGIHFFVDVESALDYA